MFQSRCYCDCVSRDWCFNDSYATKWERTTEKFFKITSSAWNGFNIRPAFYSRSNSLLKSTQLKQYPFMQRSLFNTLYLIQQAQLWFIPFHSWRRFLLGIAQIGFLPLWAMWAPSKSFQTQYTAGRQVYQTSSQLKCLELWCLPRDRQKPCASNHRSGYDMWSRSEQFFIRTWWTWHPGNSEETGNENLSYYIHISSQTADFFSESMRCFIWTISNN